MKAVCRIETGVGCTLYRWSGVSGGGGGAGWTDWQTGDLYSRQAGPGLWLQSVLASLPATTPT